MKLQEINALYEASSHTSREDLMPSLKRFAEFKMYAAGAWPSIYRELVAGRAMRDTFHRDTGFFDIQDDWIASGDAVQAFDAAREETDK